MSNLADNENMSERKIQIRINQLIMKINNE